jgi:hypothetical protein
MKFHLAKSGNKFIPSTEEDQIKCLKIGQGEVVECRSIDQRNYEFHKKFFALIKLAWENLPEKFDGYFGTPEDLRSELIVLAGFYTERKDFYGNTKKVPESIAFDKMSQERFEQLYSKVLDLVCRLIGVEETDIMDQLMEFM